MGYFGGGGVSKAQAGRQARAEASRAVKKAEAPKPGDLLKRFDVQPSAGHTATDSSTTKTPGEPGHTQIDEEK